MNGIRVRMDAALMNSNVGNTFFFSGKRKNCGMTCQTGFDRRLIFEQLAHGCSLERSGHRCQMSKSIFILGREKWIIQGITLLPMRNATRKGMSSRRTGPATDTIKCLRIA